MFEKMIGKNILGFRSKNVVVQNTSNGPEYQLAYKSYMIISEDDDNAQYIHINSNWEEKEDGSDHLLIQLEPGEICKHTRITDVSIPDLNANIWGHPEVNSFEVKSIGLFGYTKAFNEVSPTKHILRLGNGNGQQIIIKPEPYTIGLSILFSQRSIEQFFNSSEYKDLIYHVKTIE